MPVNRGHEDYRLERDIVASVRLNAQHYLWREAVGFNLHPDVAPKAGASIKIADIGTGTGIWVLDAARHNSNLQIDGFDMSLDQCPPKHLWPSNVFFHRFNFLDKPKPEFQAAYDVIHARLIQGGLQESPNPALKTFLSMLKPGGRLQWEELNLNTVSASATRSSLRHPSSDEMAYEVSHFGFGRWTPQLAEFCTKAGFADARTYKYEVPIEISIPFMETQLMAYEEISRVAMENATPTDKGPRFRELVKKTKVELDSGVLLDQSLEITVAIKSE